MERVYQIKYEKYKKKYLELSQKGGGNIKVSLL